VSGDGFLKRWSRRKRAGELPAPADPAAAAASTAAPAPGAAAAAAPAMLPAEQPPVEPVDPATLPPIESLGAGSDYTMFLRQGVPEALRRAALRRAWESDPVIRDFRTPAEYDWDFNAPEWSTPLSAEESRALLDKILPSAEPKPATPVPAPPTPTPPTQTFDSPPAEPAVPLAPPPAEPEAVPATTPATAAVRSLPPSPLPAVETRPPPAETRQETAPIRRHGGALPR
jgi:hypothetical protein